MLTSKGLAHIALYTHDIEKSIAFYEKLGGKCTIRDEIQKPEWVNKLALVDFCGFVLELLQPGDLGEIENDRGSFPHIAIEVENLEAAMEEVRACGVDNFGPIAELPHLFTGLRNVFFTGPDGEKLELLQNL